MDLDQQTRRQFCARACSAAAVAALGAAFGAALQSCCGCGPALTALRQYATQFASGVLTISA